MWNTREQAAAYLAGMIDGEGHVCISGKNKYLSIDNGNLDLLKACAEACSLLEVTYNLRQSRMLESGPFYILLVRGEINFKILLEQVPIQHAIKRERLERLVKSYKRRHPQPQTRVSV